MWWLVLAACGGDPAKDSGLVPTGDSDTDTVTAATGTLDLSFRMSGQWIDALGTGEAPSGHVWGAVFHDADVGPLGPEDGAEALFDFDLDVDMSPDGAEVGPLVTTDPLPAEVVVILAFMDTDANVDPADPEPDSGDPVTVPGENKFQVVAGEASAASVYFDLLNP